MLNSLIKCAENASWHEPWRTRFAPCALQSQSPGASFIKLRVGFTSKGCVRQEHKVSYAGFPL